MSRKRNFIFTLNNYTDEEVEFFKNIECRFIQFGKEVSDSGTPHLQGMVCFVNQRTISCLKKKISPRAHWELMRGEISENLTYTGKDKNIFRKGDAPATNEDKGENEKKRWDDMYKAAEEGRWMDVDSKSKILYQRALTNIRSGVYTTFDTQDLPTFNNLWLYGVPQAGKSRKAKYVYSVGVPYIKDKTKWWCGYKNEHTVIINEFDPKQEWMSDYIKNWADIYAFPAETKGGHIFIRPKQFIITSNFHPEAIWGPGMILDAIMARFKFEYFDTPYVNS